MKLLSLFAGGGGLDIGLEQAGFSTVLANELEEHGCKTLEENRRLSTLKPKEFDGWFNKQISQKCYRNIKDHEVLELRNRLKPALEHNRQILKHAKIIRGDIRKYSSTELANIAGVKVGELTLIAGGPPCQPFSRAGKRETLNVSDGQLFLEFVRIVDDLKPRWFLFENVKGLILSKTITITRRCNDCGETQLVSFDERRQFLEEEVTQLTCDCGSNLTSITSQNVKGGSLEIILNEFERIGYKCKVKVLNAADFGAPQIRERLIIVGSRDGEDFIFPKPTHASSTISNVYQPSLFSASADLRPWVTMYEAIWREGHPEFGELDSEQASLWVKNVVRPHDEPVTWSLHRPSPTIGAHQAAKLAIAPNGVPDKQLYRQQWHTKGRRQGDTPPVYVKHANLSDSELLRLQTFPDSWYLYGTRMQRAFQIGNAVPVILAQVIGRAIIKASMAGAGDQQLYKHEYNENALRQAI